MGSQSGTIPYDYGNIAQYAVSQYLFLQGTQPDSVILCVNPFDEEDYIYRTIRFIESSTNCNCIALVVFPMDLQNTGIKAFHSKKILPNNQFLSIQDRLIQRFHIPVYKLGDNNDMLSLYETIVDFYAEGE